MTLPSAAQEALDAFTACPGWEQRARLLMQWGERLEPLDEAERRDANRVTGCESQVWLVAEQMDGRWVFRASSDARLLRGLLALLLVRIDGLDGKLLSQVDVVGWFEQLGLSRQLSPSRSNGLNAVLQQMHSLTAGS
ncbi:SufE family protein [Pseudomonas sp. PDM11]|uniref:SufE family protein n=1 Tax=Pseudomonas sp. PDM11 TaxID=2769309 RepID=UPI00178308CB|nr:SufE family protein [Pseudomonas sp. PDM11]MBD9396136.1 SufE family protein [Pseudomonas sp. PDM11]